MDTSFCGVGYCGSHWRRSFLSRLAFPIINAAEEDTSKSCPGTGPRVTFCCRWSPLWRLWLQKLYTLGGEVAESTKKCTHLIASKVTRTVKFLTAISVVRHIVTPEWLEECFKCQKFIGECCAMVLDFSDNAVAFSWIYLFI